MTGIHRNLGVHISKVKSVSLDGWQTELVNGMKEMGGNEKANEYYEAFLVEGRKPGEDSSTHAVEAYIRDKYEKKLFVPENQKKKKKGKNVGKEEEEDLSTKRKSKRLDDEEDDEGMLRRPISAVVKKKVQRQRYGLFLYVWLM